MKTRILSGLAFTAIVISIAIAPGRAVADHHVGPKAPSPDATVSEASGGMRVTFQSCGYTAVALHVSCGNTQTGASKAVLLETTDVSAASCAVKLASACSTVGYRVEQQGATVTIYGSGIVVRAVGPTFTKTDFYTAVTF